MQFSNRSYRYNARRGTVFAEALLIAHAVHTTCGPGFTIQRVPVHSHYRSPPSHKSILRSRTRRQRPISPPNRLHPQHKIQPPSSRKHIIPLHPRLIPHLPIHPQTLHIIPIVLIAPRTSNQKTLPLSQIDLQPFEPRRPDEESRLAGERVQADHVPEDPGLHCAGVAVARDAGAVGAVVALCGVAGVFDAEVLAVDEVEEVGGVVAGLEGQSVFP